MLKPGQLQSFSESEQMQLIPAIPLFVGIVGQSIWLCAIFCLIFPTWFESTTHASQKVYLLGWWGGTLSLFGFIIHSLTATGNATFFEIGWSMSLILSLSLWWIVWKKIDLKLLKLSETLAMSKDENPTKEQKELEEICTNLQKITTNIVKVCFILWIIQVSFITATFG